LLFTGLDNIAIKIDPNVIDLCDLKQCDPKSGHKNQFSFGQLNTKEELENAGKDVSLSFSGSIYPMIRSPRGFCFLVNNFFTKGTYKEMQRLRNIFYQLHFDVEMDKNLSINELTERLNGYSKNPNLSKHDAFILIIITYCNEYKEILDSDNNKKGIEELTKIFNNENCPNMIGKPRLFIFNCCSFLG
jgi:hypothetical protein